MSVTRTGRTAGRRRAVRAPTGAGRRLCDVRAGRDGPGGGPAGHPVRQGPVGVPAVGVLGVVYIAATVGLVTRRPWSRPLAWTACSVELAGVLVVGLLSILDAEAFPRDTVWSKFGSGYVFIPLILPVVGLYYLHRTRPTASAVRAA